MYLFIYFFIYLFIYLIIYLIDYAFLQATEYLINSLSKTTLKKINVTKEIQTNVHFISLEACEQIILTG